ncbi:MAG: helix-turn-helix transcriptional regulator [bacterium]|nr:helix-turn-helix transcriptional regulator [bacterium]
MSKECLPKNLVKLRTKQNLTQKELALHLHYSDKVISKWERGESVPDIHALERVAEFYNITMNELMSEEDIESKSISKPYQIVFQNTKSPSQLMKFSILIPVILWFLTAAIDIIWFIVGGFILIVIFILWGVVLSHSKWIGQYGGHTFQIVTRGFTCRLYMDQILVDEVQSLSSNFLLFIKLKEDQIRIRVSQLFININVFAIVE